MEGMTRSLALHSDARRSPYEIVRRMQEHVTPETPPDGPEGPVAVLERRLAGLLGKPVALFFPTGTMAQQVALRVHADRRGRRGFAAHPQTHLAVWEREGYNAVHGLWRHRAGDHNELMTTEDLAAIAEPLAAVVWELPQRDIGGLLPSWEDLTEQITLVRRTGAAAHLDGARILEAQTFYERPLDELAGLFDTVYMSLYKSLQGVRGAVLAGDADLIAEAEVWRQRLGGGIRDGWPLALAALAGMDDLLPRMPEFKAHAVAIANAVSDSGVASVVPDPPQTPLFHVHLAAPRKAVERAGEELRKERDVQLYLRVRSSTDPNRCSFEVTVGENALEFEPQEVVELLGDLMKRATV